MRHIFDMGTLLRGEELSHFCLHFSFHPSISLRPQLSALGSIKSSEMPHNHHFTPPRPVQVSAKVHDRFIALLSQVTVFGYRVQHEAPGSFLLQEVKILHHDGQSLYGETKFLSDQVKSQGVDAVSNNEALVKRYNIATFRLELVQEKLTLLKKTFNAYMMGNAGGSQPIDGGQLMISQHSHGHSSQMSQSSHHGSSSQPMSQSSQNRTVLTRSETPQNQRSCAPGSPVTPGCSCDYCRRGREEQQRLLRSPSAESSWSSSSSTFSWSPRNFPGLSTSPSVRCPPGSPRTPACGCGNCANGSQGSNYAGSP